MLVKAGFVVGLMGALVHLFLCLRFVFATWRETVSRSEVRTTGDPLNAQKFAGWEGWFTDAYIRKTQIRFAACL